MSDYFLHLKNADAVAIFLLSGNTIGHLQTLPAGSWSVDIVGASGARFFVVSIYQSPLARTTIEQELQSIYIIHG